MKTADSIPAEVFRGRNGVVPRAFVQMHCAQRKSTLRENEQNFTMNF